MALKLIQVARELNVGLHTIVETLHNKGFSDVQDKPTAEINDDMLEVLQKEFQRDLAIKREADKLLRPVLKKDPVAAPTLGGSSLPPLPPLGTKPTLGSPLPGKEDLGKLNRPVLAAPSAPEAPAAPPKAEAATPPVQATPPAPTAKEAAPVQEAPPPPAAPSAPASGTPAPSTPTQSTPTPDTLTPTPPTPTPTTPTPTTPTPTTPTPDSTVVPRRELPALRVVGKIDLNPPKPAAPAKREERRSDRDNRDNRDNNRRDDRRGDRPARNEGNRDASRKDASQQAPKPAAVVPPPAQATPASDPAKVETPETADPNAVYRADQTPLRGLKVLGKINLETRNENSRGSGNNRGGNNNGRNDNRRGGQQGQQGGQQGNRPAANRPAGPADPNKPAGTGTGTNDSADRQKRKRKKVSQQPVTAASLQASMSGNQGDNRRPGGNTSGGGGNNNNNRGPQRPGGQGGQQGGGQAPASRAGGQPREISQKDIENQIRQTMARMGAGASRKRQKIRRDKREFMRERAELAEQALSDSGKLQVTEFVSVADLASLMNLGPADIIKTCMSLGIFVSINQRLDAEIIEVVASEFGFEVEFISAEEQVEVVEEIVDDPADLKPRQPIVTVMGHVDHGKTSLLDFIRNANVVSGEAGGITQHIGAYEVMVGEGDEAKKITFLDTPGHEAFTAMRARGAKVTDIAIIVIAADDSIMPQTREAISHAQAAGVPIVFAINKIDKAGADPERIKNELAQMNLMVEEWGGKYQSQDISAKKGQFVDKLLEKVVLEAEILELQANPKRRATGTVLEASMEKGRGYVTKILVENGTLCKGDPIIAGEHSGRVRAMFNDRGKEIAKAGPAMPVMVLGLAGAPQAGEKIKVAASEAEAKEIATKRAQILREQATRATKRISLEEIGRRLALGNFKELKLIVKGDVDGSVEALSDSLIKLSMEKIQVSVIHKAVGQIVDSDIMLASASDAIIVGFQVRPSLTARKLAEKEGVEIKTYSIIYEAIEEITAAMEGMLEPTKEEEIMGQVEVREVFKITKVGTVAGCYVQEGKIARNHFIRIIRDGIVTYPVNSGQNAELSSLKRFKEDAKEVRAGLECGITIRNFNDIKVGDFIESYVINEVKARL